MFKKLLSIALCGAGVFYFAGSVASASERTIYSKSIPEMANANTVIQYEGNSLWKVVEDTATDINGLSCNPETPALSFNNAINTFETSKNTRQFYEEDDGPVYEEILPDPELGMRVLYDNWGELEKIYVLNNNSYQEINKTMAQISAQRVVVDLTELEVLPKGKRLPAGTYRYGKLVPESEKLLGIARNVIKITSGNVTGKGDFSVFDDEKGDNSNYLQKGDCATNRRIDNPKSGKKITVTNKTNNISSTFTKNDNGELPNAVIDIWKTGVKKLGVNSTDYDNIKQAAVYTYDF